MINMSLNERLVLWLTDWNSSSSSDMPSKRKPPADEIRIYAAGALEYL